MINDQLKKSTLENVYDHFIAHSALSSKCKHVKECSQQ